MEIFTEDIEKLTLDNSYFRKVLKTTQYSQLVLMSLHSKEEIGEEIHHLDQTLIFIQGEGKAVLDGKEYKIAKNSIFVVPAGTKHNFINTGNEDMKLYTVYAPAEHPDGTIHKTKAEADEAEKLEHNS